MERMKQDDVMILFGDLSFSKAVNIYLNLSVKDWNECINISYFLLIYWQTSWHIIDFHFLILNSQLNEVGRSIDVTAVLEKWGKQMVTTTTAHIKGMWDKRTFLSMFS